MLDIKKKWNYEEITLPSGIVFHERLLKYRNGWWCCCLMVIALIGCGIFSFILFGRGVTVPSLKYIMYALYGMLAAVVLTVILCRGLKIIRPNEAAVFTLFGRYHITIIEPGFYFINPFATEEGTRIQHGAFKLGGIVGSYLNGFGSDVHRIPLSPLVCTINLENILNTQNGYVLSMGTNIEYRIKNPTKAVFAVNDFDQYFYQNCEVVLRETIRKYVTYGETDRGKINESVTQIIMELEDAIKNNIQEILSQIGCEVLSVVLKEVYDKKENQYYTIKGE